VLNNSHCFSFSSISVTYHFSCFYCNALLDFFSVSEALSNFNSLYVCMYETNALLAVFNPNRQFITSLTPINKNE